jgi:hypothetical protein
MATGGGGGGGAGATTTGFMVWQLARAAPIVTLNAIAHTRRRDSRNQHFIGDSRVGARPENNAKTFIRGNSFCGASGSLQRSAANAARFECGP